jgi:hypothetical protein
MCLILRHEKHFFRFNTPKHFHLQPPPYRGPYPFEKDQCECLCVNEIVLVSLTIEIFPLVKNSFVFTFGDSAHRLINKPYVSTITLWVGKSWILQQGNPRIVFSTCQLRAYTFSKQTSTYIANHFQVLNYVHTLCKPADLKSSCFCSST